MMISLLQHKSAKNYLKLTPRTYKFASPVTNAILVIRNCKSCLTETRSVELIKFLVHGYTSKLMNLRKRVEISVCIAAV